MIIDVLVSHVAIVQNLPRHMRARIRPNIDIANPVPTGHIGNYYDLTVGNTGLLMGVGNTIATIPSALSPVRLPCVIILFALVLQDQDYSV